MLLFVILLLLVLLLVRVQRRNKESGEVRYFVSCLYPWVMVPSFYYKDAIKRLESPFYEILKLPV